MSNNLINVKVQAAAPQLKGFDCDSPLISAQATQMKSLGYDFCLRYLSLVTPQQPGDLTTDEANDILSSGLALSVVQHVDGAAKNAAWVPTQIQGTDHGNAAVLNAQSIGLPTGINIWCDLEGIASTTPPQQVIDYCNAWYDAVLAAGYVPGLYVGASCILDGNQLYDLSFEHYWKSMSEVPPIPNRGYQMVQSYVPGLQIDPDMTQTDEEGGTVLWLVQA